MPHLKPFGWAKENKRVLRKPVVVTSLEELFVDVMDKEVCGGSFEDLFKTQVDDGGEFSVNSRCEMVDEVVRSGLVKRNVGGRLLLRLDDTNNNKNNNNDNNGGGEKEKWVFCSDPRLRRRNGELTLNKLSLNGDSTKIGEIEKNFDTFKL